MSHLDFDLIENLAVVNTNNAANHFWDNDHVTQVGLDALRLLHGVSCLLGLAQALQQLQGLSLQTAVEASAGTAVHKLSQLLIAEVQELIQVNTSVGVLAKGSLLPQSGLFFLQNT